MNKQNGIADSAVQTMDLNGCDGAMSSVCNITNWRSYFNSNYHVVIDKSLLTVI